VKEVESMYVSLTKFSALIVLLILCFGAKAGEGTYPAKCEKLNYASIISLIATPDKYKEKCIQSRGVLFLDDKSAKLFLSHESLENNVLFNSISITISSKSISELSHLGGRYVSVIGVFDNGKIVQTVEVGL